MKRWWGLMAPAIGAAIAILSAADVSAAADRVRLSILYDAGIHGRYLPCG